MNGEFEDLARLRGLSPADDRVDPLLTTRRREALASSRRTRAIILGIGLFLLSALMIFFAYGIASKATDPSDPAHGSQILEKFFDLSYAGWLAIPGLLGAIAGVTLVLLGFGRRWA